MKYNEFMRARGVRHLRRAVGGFFGGYIAERRAHQVEIVRAEKLVPGVELRARSREIARDCYLGRISVVPWFYIGCISGVSRVYLGYISPCLGSALSGMSAS